MNKLEVRGKAIQVYDATHYPYNFNEWDGEELIDLIHTRLVENFAKKQGQVDIGREILRTIYLYLSHHPIEN